MIYDFDDLIDRRNTGSVKWAVKDGELPMWVADMDFRTAPEILAVIRQRAEHGIFGYPDVPANWAQSICSWWDTRHHFPIQPEWLLFCNGIVPAISSILRRMTAPGDGIVVQSPVYNAFFHLIEANGRRVVESRLVYESGGYRVDFSALEQKLSQPNSTMMILCNPHNPIGRIWDRETLLQIGALCRKHQVLLLSDEIHCDITDPGTEYLPFASLSDECRDASISCIAPTKTFNLAGIQTAAVVIPNEGLRRRVAAGMENDGIAGANAFAMETAAAAFTHGGPWLDALREYLFANKQLAAEFLSRELPQIQLVRGEATYLLWLDCTALGGGPGEFQAFLRKTTGLFVSDGRDYGGNGGHFLRMNIACPRARLQDGLDRLKAGAEAFHPNQGRG